MPKLENQKLEDFCYNIVVRGMSAVESYMAIGYKRNPTNALALKSRADIAERIKELQELNTISGTVDLREYATLEGLTQPYIIKQIIEIGLEAKSNQKYKEALDAFKLVGSEMFGMFEKPEKKVEKALIDASSTTNISVTQTTPDQVKSASEIFSDIGKLIEGKVIDVEPN